MVSDSGTYLGWLNRAWGGKGADNQAGTGDQLDEEHDDELG